MDIYEPVDHLHDFLIEESFTRTAATRQRYERVIMHLLDFTDAVEASRHLGTGPAALLDLERSFAPVGAFFRLFGFDELICCLPEFLEPQWELDTPADRRAQVVLVERLVAYLTRRRLYDVALVSCARWELETAIRAARRRLTVTQPSS